MAFYAIKFSMGQHFFKSCQYEYVIHKINGSRGGSENYLSREMVVEWSKLFLKLMLDLLSFEYDAILPARTTREICIHRYLPRRPH